MLAVDGVAAHASTSLRWNTGSIFETEKRKRVVPLLYAQVAVFIAEVTFLSKTPLLTPTACLAPVQLIS